MWRLHSVLAEPPLPALGSLIKRLHAHIRYLDDPIDDIENKLGRQMREDDLGQRLMTIPGIGPINARFLSAEMGDCKHYACGRDFAASSDRCRASKVRVGERICWASANAATRTSGTCWCNARDRICNTWDAITTGWRNGSGQCWGESTPMSWLARWQTSWLAPPGPSRHTTPNSNERGLHIAVTASEIAVPMYLPGFATAVIG
jgi:hypothetical protein